jgi:hypothetical protein
VCISKFLRIAWWFRRIFVWDSRKSCDLPEETPGTQFPQISKEVTIGVNPFCSRDIGTFRVMLGNLWDLNHSSRRRPILTSCPGRFPKSWKPCLDVRRGHQVHIGNCLESRLQVEVDVWNEAVLRTQCWRWVEQQERLPLSMCELSSMSQRESRRSRFLVGDSRVSQGRYLGL